MHLGLRLSNLAAIAVLTAIGSQSALPGIPAGARKEERAAAKQNK
jgi:hypothetical protein